MTPPRRQRRQPLPQPWEQPLPQPAQDDEDDGRQPERLYVITGPDGERAPMDLVTLIVSHADPPSSVTPEQSAVLRLCANPLSVAEVSAYLQLPFSVVTVLLTEMLATELVHARAPVVRQQIPDRSLLEAVMHGLQRL